MYRRAPGYSQLPPELCVPFAHRVIWRERKRFLRLAGPPGVVAGTVIVMEALGLVDTRLAPLPWLAAVVVTLALIPVHVGWTRFLLLGPKGGGSGVPWPRPRFGRREFGVALVVALLVAATVGYGLLVGHLAQWLAGYSRPLVALLGFVAALPAALLLTRLALIPTCLAVDMPPKPKDLPRLGGGHVWALLASVIGCLLMTMVFVVVAAAAAGFLGTLLLGGLGTASGPLNPVPGILAMALVITLALVYGAGLLAGLFAHALAWSRGRELTPPKA